MPDAVLVIGGRRLAGWTDVSVTASLERLDPEFRLSMSERAPGETTPRQVNPGDAASVELDGETVLTGFVDEVSPSYGPGSHVIAVTGRDATGDLVDCSAASEPGEWIETPLAGIAAALCQPFGIPVSGGAGEPFRKFRVEEGETVFESLDRACRLRGVLPRADGRGGVVLGPVVTSRAAVPPRARAKHARSLGDRHLAGALFPVHGARAAKLERVPEPGGGGARERRGDGPRHQPAPAAQRGG